VNGGAINTRVALETITAVTIYSGPSFWGEYHRRYQGDCWGKTLVRMGDYFMHVSHRLGTLGLSRNPMVIQYSTDKSRDDPSLVIAVPHGIDGPPLHRPQQHRLLKPTARPELTPGLCFLVRTPTLTNTGASSTSRAQSAGNYAADACQWDWCVPLAPPSEAVGSASLSVDW